MRSGSLGTLTTLLLVFGPMSGCVTTSDKSVASRRIIDQTPGAEGIPAWAKGKKISHADGGRVGFLGFLTMDPASRPDSCTHAAGTEAKGRIAAMIVSNVVDESGISGDDKTLVSNRLTAALGKQRITGAEFQEEYYSLIEIDDGEKPTRRLECWAQVSIPQKVLDSLLAAAMGEVAKDPAIAKQEERLEKAQSRLREETQAH